MNQPFEAALSMLADAARKASSVGLALNALITVRKADF